MSERHRLVVVLDADIVDDDWNSEMLVQNAAPYLGMVIAAAEKREADADADQAYLVHTDDITVYVESDYVADLADIAALPEREQEALRQWASMHPAERTNMFARFLPVPSQ